MTDRDGPPGSRRACEQRWCGQEHRQIATSIALAVTLLAGPARAQDQAAIEKLVQLNKKALADYDTLEWESAKRTLLEALTAGKKAGLDNHAVMARTYVHLGAVYVTGFKDRDKALQSFTRALEIDPSIQLSRGIASQEVNEAFAEAQRQRGGGGTVTPPPPVPPKKKTQRLSVSDDFGERDLPVKITALDCPNEDEAILDRTATLRCALEQTPVLQQVANVFLIYQAPGKDNYTEVQMTKTARGWYVGKIPKKAVNGKSIRYYFEGRSVAGKTIVTNGEEANPLILLLMTEEAYRKSRGTTVDRGGPDKENPLIVPEGPYQGGKRKWWIGIGAGSGFGYAKGQGLEAVNRSPDMMFNKLASEFVPGGAWAGLLHLAPELGYQISPNVAISVEGRFQYIPQPAQYSHFAANGAISGLLKVMRYSKQARIRFFGTGIAGGGEGFRFTVHPVDPAIHPELSKVQDFKDTVRGGPIIAGAGVGMYYEASKRAAIVVEAHGLAGFPIFSFVADVNLALQINFYAAGKETRPGRYVPREENEEPK
jgi:hypothetical protein